MRAAAKPEESRNDNTKATISLNGFGFSAQIQGNSYKSLKALAEAAYTRLSPQTCPQERGISPAAPRWPAALRSRLDCRHTPATNWNRPQCALPAPTDDHLAVLAGEVAR